jgi:PhzF family phenazine biosynthesis protein
MRYVQVDVFSPKATKGNPVAVVLDGRNLTDRQMKDFATWTNLSEATFFVDPCDPTADYAIRIFSFQNEFAFAGHPTLGSAHAWLSAGGKPKATRIRQESPIGVVEIEKIGDQLFFATPPLLKSGPLEIEEFERILKGFNLDTEDVVASNWLDNGPGWRGILLRSAELVRSLRPHNEHLAGMNIGFAGPMENNSQFDYEIRAFFQAANGMSEDPITGSLQGAFGQWLIGSNLAPKRYIATQGSQLGREGVVTIFEDETGQIWVGGHCQTLIAGELLPLK